MSAIAGIYFLDGRSVDRADLQCMLERVAHRGPDGAGVWSEGAVGLGHRLLWTTPESLREELPLTNKTGNHVLTADARIDNRDELIAALAFHGRPQNEITDSELILASYEEWGERCPEKLLGDFAFVIWDGRRQVLFCARDHFGVKPFYYHHRDSRVFVFASEIKALLCLPEVPRRLNETRVADYLVPMLEDKEITFYKDILRLPPAHTLTISREGASLRPYWALDPSREVRLGSDEEYADAFRKIFTDAVHCRLRSAYPVGSMLSGGLDSSSIVCVARQLLSQDENRRLHTFSAIFDDLPQCDERPFINAVLAQGGLEPHFIRADQLSPLADIGRVLGYEDEAFYAPNLFIHWGLYCAAQQQGVRVLLDGLDGDITVSHGIGYLIELASTGRWMTLATYISGLAQNFNRSSWRILYFHVIKPLVPKPIRQAWRALRGWNATDWRLNAIINPKFAQEIGLEERVRTLQGPSNYTLRTSREYHYRGLTHGLIPFALEVADRAGAAFSLEPRYPFFDKRLAEFCLALPGEQKLHRGWSRMIMRRAMADILPAEVQWRGGKADLSPNFVRGLLAPNSQLLEQVILKDSKVLEKYIDTGVLHTAYQRYIAARTEVDALTVWKVASLALWLQHARLTP